MVSAADNALLTRRGGPSMTFPAGQRAMYSSPRSSFS
jgi:hypothetical protein